MPYWIVDSVNFSESISSLFFFKFAIMSGLTEEDIYEALVESEDEDVLENLDDIQIESESSSEESETEEESAPSTSKRRREEPREWSNSHFTPNVHEFDEFISGLGAGFNINEDSTELDFFQLFMTRDIVGMISTETNKYAEALKRKVTEPKSKLVKWVNSTVEEIYMFIATIMLMSLVGKNNLKKYWSNNKIIETPFFKTLFSQDRFFLLFRALHFVDNDLPATNKLNKIKNLLDGVREIFKKTFYPFENLCIDESLLLWKGRLSFKIYIPSKRHRFGIKLFVLCDVLTGYILDVIVYTGSQSDYEMVENLGISGSVVKTMMNDYLGKGHTLYVDNWYTSPALFDFLMQHNTNACGTARLNRKMMPKFQNKKMKKGDVEFVHSNGVLALKWKDKREIVMLSTKHDAKMIPTTKVDFSTGENKIKPEAVVEYTKNMGAVDKVDRILGFADCSRKSFKWYKKIFFRLVDCCTLNAFFLHKFITQKKLSFGEFRENLISQMCEKYHTARPSSSGGRKVEDLPIRLKDRHFPYPVPQTEAQKSRTQRKCHVCSHTTKRTKCRKDTRFMCQECDVALCVYPCFGEYHSLKYY